MKGETKCMFFIIAPHNEEKNLMYVLNHCTTQMKRETKCMFLIIAPHNEERN